MDKYPTFYWSFFKQQLKGQYSFLEIYHGYGAKKKYLLFAPKAAMPHLVLLFQEPSTTPNPGQRDWDLACLSHFFSTILDYTLFYTKQRLSLVPFCPFVYTLVLPQNRDLTCLKQTWMGMAPDSLNNLSLLWSLLLHLGVVFGTQ